MKFLIIISFLLAGCIASQMPSYEPSTNEEYIEQYEAHTDAEIKADTIQVYTYAGIALFTAGVAMCALTPRIKSGIIMIAGGALAMSTPFVFNSEWFAWVFGTAVAIALLDGLYILFRLSKRYLEQYRQK